MSPRMFGLSMRSLRHRRTAFASSFCSVLLATALIGSFATLVETASADGVGSADRQTLITMGAVVGSWGALIALFSLVSTIGIAVRQRAIEVGLLRTIGATPRQVRRLVRGETLVVALVAAVLGACAAWFGGSGLLAMLRSGDLIGTDVDYAGGPVSLGATAFALVVVSLLAAGVAGRRATRGPARLAIADGQTGFARLPRWRVVVGSVMFAAGISSAVVTATVMKDSEDPYAAMQSSGTACIVVAIGFAAIAPVLLRWFATLLRPGLGRLGVTGHLAGFNASRRSQLLAGILGPVTVFVATTIGVLMMVGIDGRTLAALAPDEQERQTITMLNYVVTGMIALFAMIMVVNSVVAVVGQRRVELSRLQLVGATRDQVRGSVVVEAWVVAGLGVVLGIIASLATVVPYSLVRDEGVVPDGQNWLPAVLAAVAVAVTLGAARVAVRRTLAASGAGLGQTGARP